MKRIVYLFKNLFQRLKKYSDANLQTAKSYTNSVANYIVATRIFTSSKVTISAGGATNVLVDFTAPSGYKTLEILWARTDGDVLAIYPSGLQSATRASTWVRNWSTSAKTITVTVAILFIKNVGGVILNRIFREAVTV